MAKKFINLKTKIVEEHTRVITILRAVYFIQIFLKWVTEDISISRPMIFLTSTLLNLAALKIVHDMPQYAHYLGPVTVLTFTSFIFNPGSFYTTSEDHCLLMFGYISLTYISASFQNLNLQITCHTVVFSDLLVWLYFTEHFHFSRTRLFFTMFIHCTSIFFIALNFEIKEKQEFSERERVERMH